MIKPLWHRIGKNIGVAASTAAILLLVACAQSQPSANVPTTSPDNKGTASGKNTALRTAEFFDPNNGKDQLTIRYFHLDSPDDSTDSILLRTPEGKTLLIDAGTPQVGQKLVDFLNKLNIQSLDAALNTHPHSDHIGGYSTLLEKVKVDKFYMENLPYPDSKSYNNVIKVLESKKIPVEYPEDGSTIPLGKDVKVEILNPRKGDLPGVVTNYDYSTINNQSMVIKVTYKQNSFLFTADIYKEREYQLVDSKGAALRSDFMDAPHHGNATSSSNTFIEAVSPKIAVISTNLLLAPDIMKRYEKNKAQVYATALHGNILIKSDGEKIQVVTEKDWQAN
ncbi:ComEC/Rec2 family competence protein [Paenibacillus sp. KN14-4R]|uniref:ComEC/Rec2 family competence protein n=1 Tax=Paenibacillus sp. KN14-4R TaxID=3445773 RepID=UPI003FA0FB58